MTRGSTIEESASQSSAAGRCTTRRAARAAASGRLQIHMFLCAEYRSTGTRFDDGAWSRRTTCDRSHWFPKRANI